MSKKRNRDRIQKLRDKMGVENGRFLKLILWERDNNCLFCKRLLTMRQATLDHLIPISKGGTNKISNMAISCEECNKCKGSRITNNALAELRFRGQFSYAEKFKKVRVRLLKLAIKP